MKLFIYISTIFILVGCKNKVQLEDNWVSIQKIINTQKIQITSNGIIDLNSIKQEGEAVIGTSQKLEQVNLVIVVDNSGSMHDNQDNLAGNFQTFINNLTDPITHELFADIKIALVSSDGTWGINNGNNPDCATRANDSIQLGGCFGNDSLNMVSDAITTAGDIGCGVERPLYFGKRVIEENIGGCFTGRESAKKYIFILTDEDERPAALSNFTSICATISDAAVNAYKEDLASHAIDLYSISHPVGYNNNECYASSGAPATKLRAIVNNPNRNYDIDGNFGAHMENFASAVKIDITQTEYKVSDSKVGFFNLYKSKDGQSFEPMNTSEYVLTNNENLAVFNIDSAYLTSLYQQGYRSFKWKYINILPEIKFENNVLIRELLINDISILTNYTLNANTPLNVEEYINTYDPNMQETQYAIKIKFSVPSLTIQLSDPIASSIKIAVNGVSGNTPSNVNINGNIISINSINYSAPETIYSISYLKNSDYIIPLRSTTIQKDTLSVSIDDEVLDSDQYELLLDSIKINLSVPLREGMRIKVNYIGK